MIEKSSLHPYGFNRTTNAVYDWAKKSLHDIRATPYLAVPNRIAGRIRAYHYDGAEFLELFLSADPTRTNEYLVSLKIPLSAEDEPADDHDDDFCYSTDMEEVYGVPDMIEAVHMIGILTQSLGIRPEYGASCDLDDKTCESVDKIAQAVREQLGQGEIDGQIFPYRIDGTDGCAVLSLDLWLNDNRRQWTSVMLEVIGEQEYYISDSEISVGVCDGVTAIQIIGLLSDKLNMLPTVGKLSNETNPYCTAPWQAGQTNGDLKLL